MKVGESVWHSLEHWGKGEWDAAMLHACNAIDGTAKKRYPDIGVGARFKTLIREDLEILRIFGGSPFDLETTRFPVPVESHLPDKRPDIADVIYGIHRCCHGHGDDLPKGFELMVPGGDARNPAYTTSTYEKGTAALPASTVIGLLVTAVVAPENKDQSISLDPYFTLQGRIFVVADWWGWRDHMREIVSTVQQPMIRPDWGDWWDDWEPVKKPKRGK
ncbi:hypothetical protein [Nocardia sp. NRRL WC-3656]|uniref:hypothetical protein n=1 Tax=Nocardia sp. NRRL WC-3656 TaxID=1463824 RepID=UPI00055C566D|nr:hypothetical protein [Nocardia sp. NRRL WC-3656]